MQSKEVEQVDMVMALGFDLLLETKDAHPAIKI